MLTARLGVSSRLRLEEEQEASSSPLLRSKPLEVLSILPRPSPIPSAVFLNPKRAGESRRKVLISWDSKKQRGLFKNEGGVGYLILHKSTRQPHIWSAIHLSSHLLFFPGTHNYKNKFFKNRELKKKKIQLAQRLHFLLPPTTNIFSMEGCMAEALVSLLQKD